MGLPKEPKPVMLFVGMLSGQRNLLDELGRILQGEFGPVAYETVDQPWNYTDYYVEELGTKVLRRFLFFRRLIQPDDIAGIKIETNSLESRYTRPGENGPLRRINLDPGYLDLSKVILATTKDYSHRIYLSRGIYAEITLSYHVRKGFRPLAHTYPDYRSNETLAVFQRAREELVALRGIVT
jgi:hypothetical protein